MKILEPLWNFNSLKTLLLFIVVTYRRYNMKKSVQIKPFTLYKVKYYTFNKFFSQIRKDCWGDFKDTSIFNDSSYQKEWVLEFSSEKSLNIQLKKWGYNSSSFFYSDIKEIFADKLYGSYLIIKNVNNEGLRYYMPKKKKSYQYKSKKRKIYHCDCFLCLGTSKEKFNRHKEREHIFLNHIDLNSI